MIQYFQFPYSEKIKDIESGMGDNKQTHGELEVIERNINYNNFTNGYNEGNFLSLHRTLMAEKINKWGEQPHLLFQLANIHLLKKNYERARDLLIKVIKLDSAFLLAYEKLIFIYILLKDIAKADANHRLLIQIANNRSDLIHNYILFRLFFYKNDVKKIDENIGYIKEIIKAEPKNYFVINTYGFILLNFKNKTDEAKKLFESVLLLNEKYVHSVNNLGVCYLKKNKIEKALDYFNKSLIIDEYYVSGYENLASVYIGQGKIEEAYQILNKGFNKKVILSKNWWHNYVWLLLETKRHDLAKKYYLDLLENEPQNNFIYNNLGVNYLRQGDRKQAFKNFMEAIKIYKKYHINKHLQDTRSLLPFYNIGRMAIDEGNNKIVIDMSNAILKLKPDDAFGQYLKGRAAFMNGNYEQSKIYFEDALKKGPHIHDVYIDLSFVYESVLHNYKSAIKILKSALKIGIKNDLIYNNLAYAYLKKGENKEAKKILDLYIKNEPPIILATKGLYFMKEDKIKEGISYYEKAIYAFRKNKENHDVVVQISLYEQALYWSKHKKYDKTTKLLSEAEKIGKSYLTPEIEKIKQHLKKKFF